MTSEQFLGEVRVALRPGEHSIHELGGRDRLQDADQLRPRLDLIQAGQFNAFDRTTAVQISQERAQPRLARFVVPVGDHQQQPLPPQVTDQERQQITGGAVGPVQILDHQHQ